MTKKKRSTEPYAAAKAKAAEAAKDQMKGEVGTGAGGVTREEKLKRLGLPDSGPVVAP